MQCLCNVLLQLPKETSEILSRFIAVTGLLFIISAFSFLIFLIVSRRRQNASMVKQGMMQKEFEQQLFLAELEMQEQTRKTLAADLHDNIGQLLSLTNVTLASVNIHDTAKAEQKINDALNLVSKSIKELRQLSKLIHGDQLIQQGLLEAIKQEVEWLQRNGYYQVEFTNDIEVQNLPNNGQDLFIYRLLQECLNNIIKHAEATQVSISLFCSDKMLSMIIKDNGKGFDTYASNHHREGGLGLYNMRKRVKLLKGDMQIVSDLADGTSISFFIPYP